MIIVGLTGGIGSGKTTVGSFFRALGVPVYIADIEAKELMVCSKVIRRKLIALFGEDAYNGKALNRAYISSKIFNDKALLDQMNAIVHPKVASHFKRWLKNQDAPYVIKEAAIIFEHNKESEYDLIITVTADVEERIRRVMERDQSSRSKVESIIRNQMSDLEKIEKSDYVIDNQDLKSTEAQVLRTHESILKSLNKSEF